MAMTFSGVRIMSIINPDAAWAWLLVPNGTTRGLTGPHAQHSQLHEDLQNDLNKFVPPYATYVKGVDCQNDDTDKYAENVCIALLKSIYTSHDRFLK